MVYDARAGVEAYTLLEDAPMRTSVEFNPDGTRLATGHVPFPPARGEIKLWDAITGRELLSIPDQGRGYIIRFTPDGNRIVATGRAGAIAGVADLWDATPRPEPKRP